MEQIVHLIRNGTLMLNTKLENNNLNKYLGSSIFSNNF